MGVVEREWVYGVLSGSSTIAGIVGTRIWQGESLDGAPNIKPFLIYRMGNTSPDNFLHVARRQYLTVYCHDEGQPGDYSQIDMLMQAVMDALINAPPAPQYHVIECRWLENSSDQDDREMGTILRYARFQLILSQWT
jgi:hypothetical protein